VGLVGVVLSINEVVLKSIYRATPLRVNPRQRNVKAVYRTYIDVMHFQKTDTSRLRGREEEEGEGEELIKRRQFPANRVEELKQMSRTHDIYERLSQALGTGAVGCVHMFQDVCVSSQPRASMRTRTSRRGFYCSCLEALAKISITVVMATSGRRSTSCCVAIQAPASHSCSRFVGEGWRGMGRSEKKK